MSTQVDVTKHLGSGMGRAMLALTREVSGRLDHRLFELIKIRASQINGCAHCLDMHTKDARAAGETEQRIYALNAWRETPFFSERERAALEWTEALTLVGEARVPEEVRARVAAQFDEDDSSRSPLAWRSSTPGTAWSSASGVPVGNYEPAAAAV